MDFHFGPVPAPKRSGWATCFVLMFVVGAMLYAPFVLGLQVFLEFRERDREVEVRTPDSPPSQPEAESE